MRFLFLGDIVGETGCNAVFAKLPGLVKKWQLDFVVVNGENASGGFGITQETYQDLLMAGADVVTTGNHAFARREIIRYMHENDRFLRPANFSKETPGRGSGVFTAKNGARVLVVNLLGRIFMPCKVDDPFEIAEKILLACSLQEQADAIIFDFHAETTSEKQCFAHFLDGRVSVIVGTHTHTPTADAQILEGGTAYLSDAGMCGDYNSSLGMDKEEPLHRFLYKKKQDRYEPARGPATLCGLAVEISEKTGLAEKVSPVRIGPHLKPASPDFW
ncbi:TIGR00282 family metallophosphoesterase [Bartonella henselae]|uniref:Metallophosphoesterase n=3 Tax=Bartonella henselae TaxID=38323 RepID=X5M623_BARHN|nr:TIGR00282 family metallophosphoesterase [Bartonella henselae]ATP13173.1 metallophosphoesterase [Bartonella henselae]ETS05998.1 metallophosphoesterase [Bartonella henselae JK 50]ETS06112.1 metallophosphoesterase [Bartonella henselae JK 51]ETS10949.1 metallophosphoesterase [Bartonella henselae JK 42]ETS14642.1 metallophosphoesterase [Bartonella henselae JK 41]